MERSSEEIEDTSEAVRSQHALGTALSLSTCRIRLACQKVSPSLNRLSVLRKLVPLGRYHHQGNLSAVPRLVKCQSSPHPPNQLTLQLPEVAECPDHQVILRTLFSPSDIVHHFFKP